MIIWNYLISAAQLNVNDVEMLLHNNFAIVLLYVGVHPYIFSHKFINTWFWKLWWFVDNDDNDYDEHHSLKEIHLTLSIGAITQLWKQLTASTMNGNLCIISWILMCSSFGDKRLIVCDSISLVYKEYNMKVKWIWKQKNCICRL